MRFNENEEAVSPVIGVILMVAITVILAAVIAVFVFGMADDVQTSKTVAATAKVTGDNVTVTYMGGPDADKVDNINATLYDGNSLIKTVELGDAVGDTNSTAIGTSDRVVVIAYFDDDTSQIILDKQI